MDIEEQLKQAYLDGSRDCFNSIAKVFHYDEYTGILTFYGIQFTVDAIDTVREIFLLSDIIKTAKTKKTLVHVVDDFEYTLSIVDDTAEIKRKDLINGFKPDINTRQIIKDGGWSERK